MKVGFREDIAVFPEELILEIRNNKEDLIKYLNNCSDEIGFKQIPSIAEALDYAVSDGQRRLWVLSQLAGGSRAYHMQGIHALYGEYAVAHLERAIRVTIGRHEVLRTVFREREGGELRQVVLPGESASMFRMSYRDFVGVEEGKVWSYVIEESAGSSI